MPIYEYRCARCGHELEAMQKFSDPLLTQCPKCSTEALVKLVSAAGFQLIAVLSFSIPFIAPGTLVLTGVAARFGAWVLITICFFVGVVEVRARRRASIGSCQNGVL